MVHLHSIYDKNGDTLEYIYFCSDNCNQLYCGGHDLEYQGYAPCEDMGVNTPCEECFKALRGLENEHGTDQTDAEFEEWKEELRKSLEMDTVEKCNLYLKNN